MRFCLARIPGTRSKIFDGPMRYVKVACEHAGKHYLFTYFEERDGVCLPSVKVYNSDDYPPDLVRYLLVVGLIEEVGKATDTGG